MKEILFWYRFVGHAQLNSLQRSETWKIWDLKKLFKLKMCLLFRKSYEDQILLQKKTLLMKHFQVIAQYRQGNAKTCPWDMK